MNSLQNLVLMAAQILEHNIVCGDFIKEWTDEIAKKRVKKISRPKTAKENVQDKYNTGGQNVNTTDNR